MKRSIGDVLDAHKGIGPGFDFARIALAFGVLAWHSPLVATGSYGPLMETPAWVLNYAILPMFFGLSGFLVAGSAQRLSLANFALNRGLRIFPALIVEIVLCALVLGPIFTHVALADYFTDRHFWSYFMNMVGWIHYHLPGVFISNKSSIVNGSLWTVPFELLCYIVMAGFIVSGIIKRGWMLVLSAFVIIAIGMALQAAAIAYPSSRPLKFFLDFYIHNGKGPALLPCFALGAAAYALRYKIPISGWWFAIAVACIGAFGIFAQQRLWEFTPITILTAPAMIYVVCYIGMIKLPRIPFFWRGDYSYGIYLYGYPIQQALFAVYPDFQYHVGLHLLASAVLATAFATFSWHNIEKPILQLRKKFSFVARREAERMATEPDGETVAKEAFTN